MAEDTSKKPGYYESPYDEYPGFVQFPYPLSIDQLFRWWEKGVQSVAGLKVTDKKFHQLKWQAAYELLIDQDGWHIEDIPPGDAKDGSAPASIMVWIVMAADSYMLEHMSPKVRLLLPSSI